MLRSTALLLDHGVGRADEARALETAVEKALAETPTPDLGGQATTAEFGDSVLKALS
jgi:3-isopropylmalate dehydrogenase